MPEGENSARKMATRIDGAAFRLSTAELDAATGHALGYIRKLTAFLKEAEAISDSCLTAG